MLILEKAPLSTLPCNLVNSWLSASGAVILIGAFAEYYWAILAQKRKRTADLMREGGRAAAACRSYHFHRGRDFLMPSLEQKSPTYEILYGYLLSAFQFQNLRALR